MLLTHEVGADLVDVEGLADALEQHDCQAPSQVLLELRESAKHAARIVRCRRDVRRARASRSDTPSATRRLMTRRHSSLGKEPGEMGVRAVERDPDADRLAMAAAGDWSPVRACARPSGRNPADGRSRARTDRRRSRCAGGGASPIAGSPGPSRRARDRRSAAAWCSRSSNKSGSRMSAAFTASVAPPRQSRSDSVERKLESLITAKGGANVPEVVLLAERVDAVLHPHRRIILRQHGRRHADQPYAAVRGRCGKPGGIEHRAAADRHEIRVAAQRRGVDRFEDAIDVAAVVLDDSPPGTTRTGPDTAITRAARHSRRRSYRSRAGCARSTPRSTTTASFAGAPGSSPAAACVRAARPPAMRSRSKGLDGANTPVVKCTG